MRGGRCDVWEMGGVMCERCGVWKMRGVMCEG